MGKMIVPYFPVSPHSGRFFAHVFAKHRSITLIEMPTHQHRLNPENITEAGVEPTSSPSDRSQGPALCLRGSSPSHRPEVDPVRGWHRAERLCSWASCLFVWAPGPAARRPHPPGRKPVGWASRRLLRPRDLQEPNPRTGEMQTRC